jgi:uncharacterized protein YhjY with autotransporter beta-barrel domain
MKMIGLLRSRLVCACGVVGIGFHPALALADCTPDPTIPSGTTNCTGTDADGLQVTTNATRVNVLAQALVQAGPLASIALAGNSDTLTMAGTVDGGATAGVRVTNGEPYSGYIAYDPYAGASVPTYPYTWGTYGWIYPSGSATLIVDAGGVVTGQTGVVVEKRADNGAAGVSLAIGNSGMISGTGGYAVFAAPGTTISSIANSATGTIGAINGAIGSVSNAGLIDGGYLTAIANTTNGAAYFNLANTGAITASGAAPTLLLAGGSLTNSGSIANNGSGAAIAATQYALGIRNVAAGTISSVGSTAIVVTSGLDLTNLGTVTGAIDATRETGATRIDTASGLIDGDIALGAGNDSVLAGTYDTANGRLTTISGSVDGGGGVNTFGVNFTADTTLTSSSAPVTSFRFEFGVDAARLTLTNDLDVSDGFTFGGTGTVINESDVVTTGQAVGTTYLLGGRPTFVNSGNITANLSGSYEYGVALDSLMSGLNAGTITGNNGNGLDVSTATGFTNKGLIAASGNAVRASGLFDNQGTIRSTAGVALDVSLGGGTVRGITSTNSGTIEGADAGLLVDTVNFANTGTISGTVGAGVLMGFYGGFDNQAGGVVSGSNGIAIGGTSGTYNAIIRNSGTLNGDINLASAETYYSSSDVFIDDGGMVNGSVFMGLGDDYVVTRLDRATVAGVTGTIDGGGGFDTLRFTTATDASASLSSVVPTNFEGLGYEVSEGAALTLTAGSPLTATLSLSGKGSIDLTADLTSTDHAVLDFNAPTTAQLLAGGYAWNRGLAVVSRGTISLTSSASSYMLGAVAAGSANFENLGVISVSASGSTYDMPAAIRGGVLVTNAGTISLSGATAVDGASTFVNTGTIAQVTGGTASQGVFAYDVTNSGTIMVAGTAVGTSDYWYGVTLTNSGNIVSTSETAVVARYGPVSVDNRAGGMIFGNGTAIAGGGGIVSNAGAIVGDVNLTGLPYYGSRQGAYIADGGTLEGNLTFGSGNDLLVESGAGFGVSGSIDMGGGSDILGHQRSTSATVTLGEPLSTGFASELVAAMGADTTVTINSMAPLTGDVYVGGSGRIVNRVATSGSISGLADIGFYVPRYDTELASFSNEADVGGGLHLSTSAFTNTANIGSVALDSAAVSQYGAGALAFANSGTLRSADDATTLSVFGTDATSGTIANNGNITGGGVSVSLSFDSETTDHTLTFDNSGTIASAWGVDLIARRSQPEPVPAPALVARIDVRNSGAIEATEAGSTALFMYAGGTSPFKVVNSGTIRSNGGGESAEEYYAIISPAYPYDQYVYGPSTRLSAAIASSGHAGSTTAIDNTGLIEALGPLSTAIRSNNALTLVNSGTINGTSGSTLDALDRLAVTSGTTALAGAIQTIGNSADTIRNSGTINGSIDLGAGNDMIVNTGTINGDVLLGAGDDSFTQRLSGQYSGTADAGDGSDALSFDITDGGVLDASRFSPFVNFETFVLTGLGTVSATGVLPIETLQLESGATFQLAAGSQLQTLGPVALTGATGPERVINRGTIVGNVDLGAGDDTFDVYAGSQVTGIVDGGAGADRLGFYLAGSATPVPLEVSHYANFERMALESGIGSYAGNISFGSVAVNDGRLIGLAGSTLDAPGGVTVSAGATFGSAGIVNGNVNVGGILLPGTMTINGNLALTDGSTMLFEMTPTASDKLVVSGTVATGSNTALQITGDRPYKPGVYTLVSAAGGISGSFTSVQKSAGVYGYVRQSGGAIVLANTLLAPSAATAPVGAALNYVNTLLTDGTGSAGFYAAVPLAADAGGNASAAALATLHPEAYASASQIGIDSGLAIAAALRATAHAGEDGGEGLFAIGQGLGGWDRMRRNRAAGTSNATDDLGGFLGGIGYQQGPLSITAFAGRLFAHQRFSTLPARTKTKGTAFGGMVTYAQAGFEWGASAIWDRSKATTRRTLFVGSTVSGRYDLNSVTLDMHVGYAAHLGDQGWRLGPQVAVTHVKVDREAVNEKGSPLALDVARRRQEATFLNVDLRLDTAATGTALRPWLSVGWQRRLDGDPVVARASFDGSAGSFTVSGVAREKSFASVGAGFDWSAADRLVFFLRGESSFDRSTGAPSVTGGFRLSF